MTRIFSKLAVAGTIAAAIAMPTSIAAQESEGRRLALLAFDSFDTSDRGYIDQGQFINFGSDVFVSMDSNDDTKLSLSEFLGWDYGMSLLAQEKGREAAYETALRVVFAFWDRNGDNSISKTEHRQSLNMDFRRADADNNAVLTEDEFTSGFSVMVALRAAINPVPAE